MKSIFSPRIGDTQPDRKLVAAAAAAPAFSLTLAPEPPAAKTEAAAVPAKKRRAFLSGGFFSGKDKESAVQAEEKPAILEEPAKPEEKPLVEAAGKFPAPVGQAPEEAVAAPVAVPPGLILPPLSAAGAPETGTPEPAHPSSPAVEPQTALPATADVSGSDGFAPLTATAAATPRVTLPGSSISQPRPNMTTTDPTASPDHGRATAQLTVSFEITSLRLTPSFKLGSMQLKALSNVVSLHLVAAQQTDNPLAAGISFQIEHVNLDASLRLKSLLLKPLGESREVAAPQPQLQVDNVVVADGDGPAPISVVTSGQAAATVQMFGTYTIAAMDFTPSFEIGSLRLEPTSNTVSLRVVPSSRPATLDLPPAFDIEEIQIADGEQIAGVRVVPSTVKNP